MAPIRLEDVEPRQQPQLDLWRTAIHIRSLLDSPHWDSPEQATRMLEDIRNRMLKTADRIEQHLQGLP